MNRYNGLVMKFSVKELLNKLKANREEHHSIVVEAKKNYMLALRHELAEKLEALDRGEKVNPNSKLPAPGDNLEEYDTAISMLGFTTDEEVQLTQDQYHCYVEDKWSWQDNFLNTAANYSDLANAKLGV